MFCARKDRVVSKQLFVTELFFYVIFVPGLRNRDPLIGKSSMYHLGREHITCNDETTYRKLPPNSDFCSQRSNQLHKGTSDASILSIS